MMIIMAEVAEAILTATRSLRVTQRNRRELYIPHSSEYKTPNKVTRGMAKMAGARAAWKFWTETYGAKVKRWPVIMGKDPSDASFKGLDLRQWVLAGLL